MWQCMSLESKKGNGKMSQVAKWLRGNTEYENTEEIIYVYTAQVSWLKVFMK